MPFLILVTFPGVKGIQVLIGLTGVWDNGELRIPVVLDNEDTFLK